MKSLLLKSRLGHYALELRNSVDLIKAALARTNAIHMLSNDILATKLVTRICQPDKVFIDIGAHIGSIIYEVQRYDQTIRIVAVEAVPEKVKKLKNTFPAVKIYECALGDKCGEASFYINEVNTGYSSLHESKNKHGHSIKEIKVQLKKLDDLENFEDVDAIKIDVEGEELGVINGGYETINRNRPIIMFESAPGDNAYKAEMWHTLNKLDYHVILPSRLAHYSPTLPLDGFIDSHAYPRITTNYFAVPTERSDEYRDRARKILGVA